MAQPHNCVRSTVAILMCANLVCACTTTLSGPARKVAITDDREVANCRMLGEVHGSSGWGNLAASAGMENAKNEALEQAAALGATHVTFTNVAGGYSPYATGKAYRCGGQ